MGNVKVEVGPSFIERFRAKLIAAACNALPALLAAAREAERLRAENERMRAALRPFAELVRPGSGRFSADVYSDTSSVCISNGELTVSDLKRALEATK